jgi:hypothetical protein
VCSSDLAPVSDAVVAAPVALGAADLERVCRAGLAAVHEQSVDAITVDAFEGEVATLSWPAPVDGGRMRAQCRVQGDVIAWKPLDRPVADQNRWMTEATDPVVRFTTDGERIAVSRTAPDGAVVTTETRIPMGQG